VGIYPGFLISVEKMLIGPPTGAPIIIEIQGIIMMKFDLQQLKKCREFINTKNIAWLN